MQRALLEDPHNEHTDSEVERSRASTAAGSSWPAPTPTSLERASPPDVRVDARQAPRARLRGRARRRAARRGEPTASCSASNAPTTSRSRRSTASTASTARARRWPRCCACAWRRPRIRVRQDRARASGSARCSRTTRPTRRGRRGLPEHPRTTRSGARGHRSRALELYVHEQAGLAEPVRGLRARARVVVGRLRPGRDLAKMARLAWTNSTIPRTAVELWKQVLELRGEDPEALNALGHSNARRATGPTWSTSSSARSTSPTTTRPRPDLQRTSVASGTRSCERDRNAVENWERVLESIRPNTTRCSRSPKIHRAAARTQELVDTLHRVIDVGAATLDDARSSRVTCSSASLRAHAAAAADAVDAYNGRSSSTRATSPRWTPSSASTRGGQWETRSA